jgi:hypothetical protein
MTRPPTTTELLDPLADLDGEDLACLGLRRANAFIDVFTDLNRQAHEDWITSLPKSKARKPRKPTLESVAKQASKAGIDVARYEVEPDGAITVITGEPTPVKPGNPWPLDEFRTKETKQ